MAEWEQIASTAARIQEIMDERDWAPADVARASGLNKSTISRYLSGEMEPKQNSVIKLAKGLDVSEMWLWGYDVPRSRTAEQKKNDDLVKVIAQLRSDPEFFNVVSMLAELPAEQYASIKQLLATLVRK